MKKYSLYLLFLGLNFSIAKSQTIPNPGFENWSNQITYDTPDNWGTTNGLTAVTFTFTATKATGADKRSGNSALKLETKSIFGQTAPGIAVTGTVTTTSSGPHDFKGIPINFRPVGLTGWFKYTPGGTDTGSAEIFLSKWNSAMQRRDDIGSGTFEIGHSVATYTQFFATINYTSSDMPDTAVIILLSGSDANTTFGSKLFIDDLAYMDCSSLALSVVATDESADGANDGTASANLTVGATPYSYMWSNLTTTQTISGLGKDNYCVTVTDGAGCTITGCDSVRAPQAVGISIFKEQIFAVYPNPVSSNFQVIAAGSSNTLMLFDAKGSKCLESLLNTGTNTINTISLTEGIYFYSITNKQSGKVENGRIVISK